MTHATFFRLLEAEDKSAALLDAIQKSKVRKTDLLVVRSNSTSQRDESCSLKRTTHAIILVKHSNADRWTNSGA